MIQILFSFGFCPPIPFPRTASPPKNYTIAQFLSYDTGKFRCCFAHFIYARSAQYTFSWLFSSIRLALDKLDTFSPAAPCTLYIANTHILLSYIPTRLAHFK